MPTRDAGSAARRAGGDCAWHAASRAGPLLWLGVPSGHVRRRFGAAGSTDAIGHPAACGG
ncbi:hypothetical protein IA54_020065 [Xanthomonas phaseoli pv. syngonii LMG 9055]|uniref:Uncharacterized protein n=1 Tax=Xanthomonas phaseoli pv. syngonii LMG 9055 TaxID=1437878 RepID=A0A1V9HJ93_9XANT|nr:hypothetical protein IA54_020065 [Xanthomonas phaseoli pv. syngonii LMG 9055]